MRSLSLAVLLLVPLAAAQDSAIVPEPRELPMCDVPSPVLFADVGTGIENLAFDGNGSLFLTAFGAGLYQASPNGTVRFVAKDSRPVPSNNAPSNGPNNFMGVDLGPDGALYVSEGMAITAPVAARVLRFPVPGQPEFEVYADGFDGANGLEVMDDGVVYLAHGFRSDVWRITGPGQWAKWQDVPSANGLVRHPDGRIVVGQFADPAQGILAIDTTSGTRETLFTFNPGVSLGATGVPATRTDGALLTKGIDDLVVLDDGRIVVSAHFRLQFLLGDPATGGICVLLDGARAEPTSARVARGFGAWDGWVFLTDNSGDIHAVDLRPAPVAGLGAPVPAPAASPDREAPALAFPPGLLAIAAAALLARRP